ncbi:hypothetical protein IW140_005218 [Coemansia sp. RSA 1813]|nr:hypothetical protein EV178_002412 [Coemansia sp. RSA 1646]KAJ1768705.1 hypothetical protein LPJ74_004669 [Coemansia sp. RSA 1843]KAJ2093612.1 hypothetical protein IW138_000005 [Coemansia sp. RSA 986]KAJ2215003.1 hypothetical protein EV179_002533 [Coemansia sp. RSA 487]KAJ2565753.1 hypothetical protein IW140_005218 [Coemansia sp. RSA 1813]
MIGVFGNKVRVPRIGLGIMGVSTIYGTVNDDESIKVLNHAIDTGYAFWDTANAYGVGHNESLLARVLKGRRNELFLCAKFGAVIREPKPEESGDFSKFISGVSGKPDYVRKYVEESLERLGVDYIDLYYMHRMDPSTPIEETVATMAELVKEEKMCYIGLFECSAWPIHVEIDGVLDTCCKLDITVVAYSPLDHGFMTGQIRSFDDLTEDDWHRKNPHFKPEHFENNLKLIDTSETMAKKYDCKPRQLGLAQLLSQDDSLIAIPGTEKSKYLENFAAGQVKLSDEDLKALRKLVDSANIQGDRY